MICVEYLQELQVRRLTCTHTQLHKTTNVLTIKETMWRYPKDLSGSKKEILYENKKKKY